MSAPMHIILVMVKAKMSRKKKVRYRIRKKKWVTGTIHGFQVS